MPDVSDFLETGEDNWKGRNGSSVKRVRVDFSAVNVSAADIVQLFTTKAGLLVHNVFSKIVTIEDSTATGNIGDTDADNGFDDAINLESAVGTLTQGLVGTDAYVIGSGKLYSAEKIISFVPDNDLDSAVVDFYIHATDLTDVD
jgi:hypothetical protein